MNHPYRTTPVNQAPPPAIPLSPREAAEVEHLRARSVLILARANLVDQIRSELADAQKASGSYWYAVQVDALRKMYETVMTDTPVMGDAP